VQPSLSNITCHEEKEKNKLHTFSGIIQFIIDTPLKETNCKTAIPALIVQRTAEKERSALSTDNKHKSA